MSRHIYWQRSTSMQLGSVSDELSDRGSLWKSVHTRFDRSQTRLDRSQFACERPRSRSDRFWLRSISDWSKSLPATPSLTRFSFTHRDPRRDGTAKENYAQEFDAFMGISARVADGRGVFVVDKLDEGGGIRVQVERHRGNSETVGK